MIGAVVAEHPVPEFVAVAVYVVVVVGLTETVGVVKPPGFQTQL